MAWGVYTMCGRKVWTALKVLAFMKDMGIVYEETHLYKIDTSKMQECKISFNGLLSMNFDQLEEGYRKFKSWDANVH